MTTTNCNDIRESVYNDCAIGPAHAIQLPREAVTRLLGLVVDLDANILKPNPWFPPADSAEKFYAGIAHVLDRHPVLRHAEIRDTGRWLHAIVRFTEPVELRSARDQQRWTAIHQMLMTSVPADPSPPALIALTRQIGSTNSKTGRTVRMLKPANAISADELTDWIETANRKPFGTFGRVIFGDERITPCPYCSSPESHLDFGDVVGFCYGACQQIPFSRFHEAFLKGSPAHAKSRPGRGKQTKSKLESAVIAATDSSTAVAAAAPLPLITIDQDCVLDVDGDRVTAINIRIRSNKTR